VWGASHAQREGLDHRTWSAKPVVHHSSLQKSCSSLVYSTRKINKELRYSKHHQRELGKHVVQHTEPGNKFQNFLKFIRGGRRRPLKGVLLKCELSMGAPAGKNQAQYPGRTDSTWAWMLPAESHMPNCLRREPNISMSIRQKSPPTALIWVIFK